MIRHLLGTYPRRKPSQIRVRGRLQVAALTSQPESKRLPPMMLENLVESSPREQSGELVCRTAAEQILLQPVSRQEFVHRHRCEEGGQPRRLGIASRIHMSPSVMSVCSKT